MLNPIAIIAGEPNSISSEIIFKSWKLRKKYNHKNFFIIGNIKTLNLQKKKLKYHINIKKINRDFKANDLNGTELDSMKTPSFPSGHAIQGYLLGEYL